MNTSLGHLPQAPKWAFDDSVAECFDDMLARSIPQYVAMREAVTRLACRFATPEGWIVDLGTSLGTQIERMLQVKAAGYRYLGIECSRPMLERAQRRLAGYIEAGIVELRDTDLRKEYPRVPASVVLSVLTLQFTPIEYRQTIVQRAYDSLRPGGAMILVEKILGADARLDEIMVGEYYALKGDSGYTGEEIARKRASLEGVLVPVTAAWNEQMLRAAGFRHVECFYRMLNFAGWFAIKE